MIKEITMPAGGQTTDTSVIGSWLVKKGDTFFDQQKGKIRELQSLALLDGLVPQIWSYKDDLCDHIEIAKKPPIVAEKKAAKVLESQEDIDAYVERMRSYLTAMMKDCDGIKLN